MSSQPEWPPLAFRRTLRFLRWHSLVRWSIVITTIGFHDAALGRKSRYQLSWLPSGRGFVVAFNWDFYWIHVPSQPGRISTWRKCIQFWVFIHCGLPEKAVRLAIRSASKKVIYLRRCIGDTKNNHHALVAANGHRLHVKTLEKTKETGHPVAQLVRTISCNVR